MKSAKKRVDPRDPSDVQTLLDYCLVVEQQSQAGCSTPETSASTDRSSECSETNSYCRYPYSITQVRNAIKIFDVMHPDAVMLMFFDQSSAHNAFASNALNARKMNVTPGGKQPAMHDTIIPLDNPHPTLRGQPQSMVFEDTHFEHPGKLKGMEQGLKERGLWDILVTTAGGKRPLGRCKSCKASAASREKALTEAQAALELNPDFFGSIGMFLFGTYSMSRS